MKGMLHFRLKVECHRITVRNEFKAHMNVRRVLRSTKFSISHHSCQFRYSTNGKQHFNIALNSCSTIICFKSNFWVAVATSLGPQQRMSVRLIGLHLFSRTFFTSNNQHRYIQYSLRITNIDRYNLHFE